MEVHEEEKYRHSPHRKLILLALRTLQFAGQCSSNDNKTHAQQNVSRAPFPHITLLLWRRKEFPLSYKLERRVGIVRIRVSGKQG